ncbi:hypothetical protein SAMN05216167_13711 [Spirosoma endophyticum]|uniref:Uncharacterized protein n=1 Tax=Spirosoma endophyticum TaxID=662367 RepID=A0A1I2H387_9BACT|nr:hypothetical protein SAMN05216167_13711 [Spirosoma endophyticum]
MFSPSGNSEAYATASTAVAYHLTISKTSRLMKSLNGPLQGYSSSHVAANCETVIF